MEQKQKTGIKPFKKGSLNAIGKSLSESLKEAIPHEKHHKHKRDQSIVKKQHRFLAVPKIVEVPPNFEPELDPVFNQKPDLKPKQEPKQDPKPKPGQDQKQTKEPSFAPKFIKKQYTNAEISEKLNGYMKINQEDFSKIDLGEFVRFFKGKDFYAGGQIVWLGYNKNRNSPYWMYTSSLIPIEGKFANRYTVFWKDITELWKRCGRPIEIEILRGIIDTQGKRLDAQQEKINIMTKFLLEKFGGEFRDFAKKNIVKTHN